MWQRGYERLKVFKAGKYQSEEAQNLALEMLFEADPGTASQVRRLGTAALFQGKVEYVKVAE